jgi:hypothetical protein
MILCGGERPIVDMNLMSLSIRALCMFSRTLNGEHNIPESSGVDTWAENTKVIVPS